MALTPTLLELFAEAPLNASELLRMLHHDEPFLFIGAACTTVALIAVGIYLLRRRADSLLLYFALFSFLYGQRLWLRSDVLQIGMPAGEFARRLQVAIGYLVPIPGFLFLAAAGFIPFHRFPRILAWLFNCAFLALAASTLIWGPRMAFDLADSLIVTVGLTILLIRSFLKTAPAAVENHEQKLDGLVLRLGFGSFVVGVAWDNFSYTFWHGSRLEPFGLVLFLVSLGFVAARRAMERERELMEVRGELELAQRIQYSILPTAFPESPHFRVAARYLPMNTVAGDLYDFVHIDSEDEPGKMVPDVRASRAGILIADVSGHGVPAALIASMVKMAASTASAHNQDPAELLMAMNRALCGNTQQQFVTAAYVHLDAQTRLLHYAAAGHPAMLLLRGGRVEEIVENGLPLGIAKEIAYEDTSLPLAPGDRLILHTDGLLEAHNASGQMFGEERLHKLTAETAALRPEEAADRIMAAVTSWSRVQEDDLTVIVCDFLG